MTRILRSDVQAVVVFFKNLLLLTVENEQGIELGTLKIRHRVNCLFINCTDADILRIIVARSPKMKFK